MRRSFHYRNIRKPKDELSNEITGIKYLVTTLNKTVASIILTAFLFTIGSFNNDSVVSFLGAKLPRPLAIIASSVVYIFINLYVTAILTRIKNILNSVSERKSTEIKNAIKSNAWILNPFYGMNLNRKRGIFWPGYLGLIGVWWLCYLSVQTTATYGNMGIIESDLALIASTSYFAFYLIFLGVGLINMSLINKIGRILTASNKH